MAKKDTGCSSFIGIIGIVLMSVYVLFTNPEQFFESAFNILGFFAIIILIAYFAIFFPNDSKEQKKGKSNIVRETKPKEKIKVITKIPKEKKIITNKLNDIDFLENLVFDLDESSIFEITFSFYGETDIYGLLDYNGYHNKNYKKEGKFKNFNEALQYLRKNTDND
jgi:hypothetical protein